MRKWIAAAALLAGCLMVVLLAGCSTTSGMSPKDLVGHFTQTAHVYVDGDANPKLASADKVNDQVRNTEQILGAQFDPKASFHGIFIANVTDSSITPDNLRQAFADKYGSFSGAITIINHQGYTYRAFDVSQGWSAANDQAFRDARNNNRGNVYGTVTAYLASISHVSAGPPMPGAGTPAPAPKVPVPAQVEVPAPTPPAPADYTGWWIALWSILAVILGTGAFFGGRALYRHNQDTRRERDEVNGSLIGIDTHLTSLSSDVLDPSAPDVSRYTGLANTLYGSARDARDLGDYRQARHYAREAEAQLHKADRVLDPDLEKIAATPERERVKATVSASKPGGGRITIRNDDYSRRRHGAYQHPYRGGEYQGVYFYPGFYPNPFWMYNWGPTEVVVHDQTVVPDQWNGDYTGADSSGSYSGYDDSSSQASSAGAFSSFTSSRDDTPAPTHHSSYSSPSSSSSSYGSSDGGFSGFGGGFDSGGGGGGFDSGGGSSGF